jgi:hypothetical protein
MTAATNKFLSIGNYDISDSLKYFLTQGDEQSSPSFFYTQALSIKAG